MHQGNELYIRLRGPGKNMTVLATPYSEPANLGGTGFDEPRLIVLKYGVGRIFHSAIGHDVIALSSVLGWRGNAPTRCGIGRDRQSYSESAHYFSHREHSQLRRRSGRDGPELRQGPGSAGHQSTVQRACCSTSSRELTATAQQWGAVATLETGVTEIS